MTLWIVARQVPLSMGFPRQECGSGLPFSSPGDLPNPGSEPMSLHWQADSLPLSYQGNPNMNYILLIYIYKYTNICKPIYMACDQFNIKNYKYFMTVQHFVETI